MGNVRVVERASNVVLVEYTDEAGLLQRTWLPKDGDIHAPELGIPYAEPLFTEQVVIQPDQLNQSLRERGLWTVQDIARRPALAIDAMVAVAGLSLSQLYRKSRRS